MPGFYVNLWGRGNGGVLATFLTWDNWGGQLGTLFTGGWQAEETWVVMYKSIKKSEYKPMFLGCD
jgi:hypothetical protein